MNRGWNAEVTVEAEATPVKGTTLARARKGVGEEEPSEGSPTERSTEPASGFPARPERPAVLTAAPHTGTWSGDALLRMGHSVRLLAVTVIVLLSGGLGVLIYGQLKENGAVANVRGVSNDLLSGFGFLMVLTIGYLVAKNWTTSRDQRRLISQLLEEEAIARAQRLNPITQFHHPEVCRDILLQQASHAARLHAPLSLLELNITGLGEMAFNPDLRPLTEGFVRQVRRLCRSTDSLLRWTPDSYLLVFPEVTRDELVAITNRIRQELEKWIEEHFEAASLPTLRWRGVTSKNLDASGDVLLEAQRLLENETPAPVLRPELSRSSVHHEKSIGLALELELCGVDAEGKSFHERIVTERVGADRIWFVLKQNLPEQCSLTVSAPDGSFAQEATLVRRIDRCGEGLAEVQFAKAPEHWVVRA